MNKKIIALVITFSVLLVSCQDIATPYMKYNGVSGSAVRGKETSSVQESETKGVNTGEVVSGSGIHSADNVTLGMQAASYWVDRMTAPDKLCMRAQEISTYNETISKRMLESGSMGFYDLESFGSTISDVELKEYINSINISMQNYVNVSGGAITPDIWQEYYDNCAIKEIEKENIVQYGIVCERADVRGLPTEEGVYEEAEKPLNDIFQRTALSVNEPVLILHTSKDKKWYFVVAEEYTGWIASSKAGLCNREIWNKARNPERFLVVTGDCVELHMEPGNEFSGEYAFTMGTRLMLAENKEWQDKVSDSYLRDNYVVKVPKVNDEGQLTYAIVSIPIGKEVHIGYLEYTKANVVKQVYKMLGNPYGWGGMNGNRDCSSLVRDVYLCFGIRLPRNSEDMEKIGTNSSVDLKEQTDEQKNASLMSAEAGDLLVMSGHVMIYLGCENRNHFVISAVGGTIRRVVVNDLHMKTEDGTEWLKKINYLIKIG